MIIKNDEVYGFNAAIRGARNPMNSWAKSDSKIENGVFVLGANDLDLATRLIKAGTEHAKFLRFITCWVDLELPFYLWKEFDTYKFVEKNSCSTMHKITSRLLDPEIDFEFDKLDSDDIQYIAQINELIVQFNATPKDDKETRNRLFRKIIQKLPESYLQRRTVVTNYAELRNIYKQRKNHKLSEWHEICKWIESLPYSELITM